jgi:hypothetical protein
MYATRPTHLIVLDLVPVTPHLKDTVVFILLSMFVNVGESSVCVLHCNMLVATAVLMQHLCCIYPLLMAHGKYSNFEFSITL